MRYGCLLRHFNPIPDPIMLAPYSKRRRTMASRPYWQMAFMQNRPDLTHWPVINSKLKKTMSHLRYLAHDVFDT